MKRLAVMITMLGVGLAFLGNAGMADRPKLAPSAFAPAAVTDLRASALSDTSVVLQWTEVRSTTSSFPRYVLRYGPVGSFDWSTATDVKTGGCAAPISGTNAAGGKPHACVQIGLASNRAYLFQVVPFTGTLNTTGVVFGPLSNVAEATTMERVGPMLVLRPRMWLGDSFPVHSAWIDAYPDTLPLRGWFRYGSYVAIAFGANDSVVARGYLLVAKP